MYDAKKDEKEKDNTVVYNTIYDRGYYNKTKMDNVINTKTSYVPTESLYFE